MTTTDYTLGSGELYIAAGALDEGELVAEANLAGRSAGDAVVRREYSTEDICNEDGAVVRTLVRESRLSIEGTLLCLPVALAFAGGGGVGGSAPVLSAAYVADGVCVFARGCADGPMELVFGRRTPTGVRFRLRASGGAEIRVTEAAS